MIELISSTEVSRLAMNDQVDHRDVDRRHAHRITVELAVELGQHQADRRRGTGLGRDHVHRCGARATQVLVVDVGQHLVVGVGVDRGHQASARCRSCRAAAWPPGPGSWWCSWRWRSPCALALSTLVVDAVDDRRVDVLAAGGRDDHLLRARLQVRRGLLLASVNRPVHSITTSTPSSAHGSSAGLRMAQTRMRSPLTIMLSPSTDTVPGNLPCAVSYLVRWALVCGVAEVVDGDDLDVVLLAALRRAHAGCCGRCGRSR